MGIQTDAKATMDKTTDERCFLCGPVTSRVEAGSNTFTVALRVVGGDEKESGAWGYNRTTLFLGDINTGA
jgi:hypothetical protein